MPAWKRAFSNLGATSLDGSIVIWRKLRLFAIHKAKKFPGITASLALHFFLLILMLGGFVFDWFKPTQKTEPLVITAEILPIKDITNIKPKQAKKKAQKKPKKKVIKAPAKPRAKPTSKPKPKPKLKKPKAKVKNPAKKPKEKKKEKPKPKKKDDFESVLKNLEKTREGEKKQPRSMGSYNPDLPLSISERDAFRKQLQKCWSILPGARNADKIAVTIYFKLARDGSVTSAKVINAGKYKNNTFFRASADAALRAVYDCSPFKNLPVKKYETWSVNEFTFDPKEMF